MIKHIDASIPYNQVHHLTLELNGQAVHVSSKPGLPDWDQLLPSTQLLAEHAVIHSADNILQLGCHHGALSVNIAHQLLEGSLAVTDTNIIALEMTQRSMAENDLSLPAFFKDPDLPESAINAFDAAFIQLPKGRQLARRWILQSYHGLIEGGILYLAGSKNAGIQPAIKDAVGLFGAGRILAYKKGNRVAQLVKQTAHTPQGSWALAPGIAPGTWVEFEIDLSGTQYHIRSLPGVFSHEHLDPGTAMLLDTVDIPPGAMVLDVGCGYGILGCFAATHGAAWVDLVDNDLLAVASSKETVSTNHIHNASVYPGDLLEPVISKTYDLILSNPPFHAGQAVDYQAAHALIAQSYLALTPGGQLLIVANRFIPYDRLIKQIFGNVTRQAESGKFHVLCGLKSGL